MYHAVLRHYSTFCHVFRPVTHTDAAFAAILPYFVMREFSKRNFLLSRCIGDVLSREGIKFQRSRTYVPDRKGRLSGGTCAKFRQVDPTIAAPGAKGRQGEGNFCDRAIILSASLKDRTNRNTGRLWGPTCVGALDPQQPFVAPVKIEPVIWL